MKAILFRRHRNVLPQQHPNCLLLL